MPNQQTQQYIRNYIEQTIKNDATNFAIKTVARALDWTITMAVGYEVGKITSDEAKDKWTYIEFAGVIALCACIWIIKCCCLNKFCINCCLNCFNKRQQNEDIEIGNEQNAVNAENTPKIGIWANILQKMHMILNRLAVGAIGYEVRKQLFKFKPLGTWDYVEISIIGLFCLWILTIKYCILKCHFLKCCCPCCFKKTSRRAQRIEVQVVQNESVTDNTSNVNAALNA